MTKSEVAEEAWRRAAKFLILDVTAHEQALPEGDPEWAILRHIEEVVIPSLLQRAAIIRRNRKDWAKSEGA